jgi:hypothetical protein
MPTALSAASPSPNPRRSSTLLYLDAFVPDHSESCWSMTNDEQRQWYSNGSGHTGLAVAPLPFDERARPHPLGTLMKKSRFSGRWKTIPRKHYGARMIDTQPGKPLFRLSRT